MARPSKIPPNLDDLLNDLVTLRELASSQRTALESVKKFLLDLHKQSVYLPSDLQSRLSEVLAPVLNGSFARPRGRAAQRTREEKRAIVQEYYDGLAMRNGNASAVARKYGVHPNYIHKWKREIDAAGLPKDQKWIKKRDPFVEALAGLSK